MVSKELWVEIKKLYAASKEMEALISARDVQGIIAKLKEAGLDVTEADVNEYLLSLEKLSDDEMKAVSGGCILHCPVDKCND